MALAVALIVEAAPISIPTYLPAGPGISCIAVPALFTALPIPPIIVLVALPSSANEAIALVAVPIVKEAWNIWLWNLSLDALILSAACSADSCTIFPSRFIIFR